MKEQRWRWQNCSTFLPIWFRKCSAYLCTSSGGIFLIHIVFVLPFLYIPRRNGCTALFNSVLIVNSGLVVANSTMFVRIHSRTPRDEPSKSLYRTTSSFNWRTPRNDMIECAVVVAVVAVAETIWTQRKANQAMVWELSDQIFTNYSQKKLCWLLAIFIGLDYNSTSIKWLTIQGMLQDESVVSSILWSMEWGFLFGLFFFSQAW